MCKLFRSISEGTLTVKLFWLNSILYVCFSEIIPGLLHTLRGNISENSGKSFHSFSFMCEVKTISQFVTLFCDGADMSDYVVLTYHMCRIMWL